MLKFEGAYLFRARLVSSILSNRPASITKIRELSDVPGVTEYEVSFAQLLDKLTNGTSVAINSTGTAVSIRPGYVIGGAVEHDCVGRSVGYYLEGVLPLCLFSKRPVQLTLTGITNDEVDICVDLIKAVTVRVLARFGLEQPPHLAVVQRGLPPRGKGKVVFSCPVVRELKPLLLVDPGFVQKVRGVAYGLRVSPQFTNRMATTIRGIFNELLPDVYINTDHQKGKELDLPSDPGYGVSVFSESTTGCFHGSKRAAIRQSIIERAEQRPSSSFGASNAVRQHSAFEEAHPGVAPLSDPESVGENAADQLLEEIGKGGCVDTAHQPLVLMLMALGTEDVSKVRLGRLSAHTVHVLRLIKDAFGVVFKIKVDEADGSVLCSCVGMGYKNLSRKVT